MQKDNLKELFESVAKEEENELADWNSITTPPKPKLTNLGVRG